MSRLDTFLSRHMCARRTRQQTNQILIPVMLAEEEVVGCGAEVE